jgi:hypothetical protein
MSTRSNIRIRPRPRAYTVKLNAHDSNTSNAREAIATPAKGKRIRVVRVRAVQETSAGRRQYEVYFGAGANITANPAKAIDVLDIPDLDEASTRTFLREEGPRGLRDEVLSGRWAAAAPSSVHKIMVEYEEDP